MDKQVAIFFEYVVGDYLGVLEKNSIVYDAFIVGLKKVASMAEVDLKQFDVDGHL